MVEILLCEVCVCVCVCVCVSGDVVSQFGVRSCLVG